MTEIEKIKSEIKVLEAKLSFLEELEQTKSPVEEAFKRVFSYYPEGCDKSFWISFQKGYEAAMQDYKVGEYQEPEEEQGTWNYDPDAKFRKQEPEENEWKNVALEFGKNLPVSLPHSYDKLSPNAWYRWAVFTYDSYMEQRDKECGYTPKSEEVKKLEDKNWYVNKHTDGILKPSIINCVLEGNPPRGYISWTGWFNSMGSKGILHNIKISALDSNSEKSKIDALAETLLPDDHPYKITDEHGETNPYKQFLNSINR